MIANRRISPLIFFSALLLLLLLTCKKEYSYEGALASGSLQDSADNCLPKAVFGNYHIDSGFTDSNYLQVEVRVDKPGTYTIYTDTINGYYFEATGTFSATGLTTVNLPGFGKPLQNGTDNFTVFFDTSICNFSIILSDTNSIIVPSQYSFLGDSCMVDSLLGFYIKGIPVSDTARLSFPVDVKVPGSYVIYTDTIDGYSFFAKGIFTTTGTQNVVLHCFGVPQNVGTDVFKVLADSAVCYFTVPVLLPIVPANNDHFPLSLNSYWSYNDIHNAGDTIIRKISSTASTGGISYKVFTETNESAQQSLSNFRKDGNDYYEYFSGDKYTTAVTFKTPVYGELHFLKEVLNKGDQWMSDGYTGITTDGQQKTVQYSFTCLGDNNYYIVNGIAFSNVYIIAMFPMIRSSTGDFAPTGEETDTYYARGIGIIYQQNYFNDKPTDAIQLRHWNIN